MLRVSRKIDLLPTAVALIRWTTGLLPYTAAVVWAFVGAVAGAAGAGEPLLAAAAGVGLATVLAAALTQRTTALQPPAHQ